MVDFLKHLNFSFGSFCLSDDVNQLSQLRFPSSPWMFSLHLQLHPGWDAVIFLVKPVSITDLGAGLEADLPLSLNLEKCRTLWGFWTQKPFCVPCLLFAGNRFYSASKTSPEFQTGRFKQMLIREGRGCRDKGGAVKKQCSLGAGSLSPLRGYTEQNLWAVLQIFKPPPSRRS